jgi:hypothetical protein
MKESQIKHSDITSNIAVHNHRLQPRCMYYINPIINKIEGTIMTELLSALKQTNVVYERTIAATEYKLGIHLHIGYVIHNFQDDSLQI